MKGNFKATAAIALLDNTKLAAPAVKKFGDAVAETFCEIARAERMNAARAIMTGMALPILKASMNRGEFTPWMKANLTRGKIWTETTAIKNASFYTRLAHKFIEETKLDGKQILAVTNGDTVRAEAGSNNDAAALLKKLDRFIDGRSLTELLEDYGIKSGSGSGGKTIEIPASNEDPLRADLAERLVGLRQIILTPETLKRFSAAELLDLDKQIYALPEDYRKLREQMK